MKKTPHIQLAILVLFYTAMVLYVINVVQPFWQIYTKSSDRVPGKLAVETMMTYSFSPLKPFLLPGDAIKYYEFARKSRIVDLPYNMIGPAIVWKISNFNLLIPLTIYFLIFSYLVLKLRRYFEIDIKPFLFLFFINPYIFSSFILPNKEIAALLSIMLVIVYRRTRDIRHLLLGLVIGVTGRFQFFLIIIVYVMALNFRPKLRVLVICVAVVFLSVGYRHIPDIESRRAYLFGRQTDQSVGVTVTLENIAWNGGFAVVAPIRIALNYFESIVVLMRAGILLADYKGLISTVLLTFVTLKAWKFRRPQKVSFFSDVGFMFALIMMMIATVPFPHHRYLAPAYPLLLFAWLTQRTAKSMEHCSMRLS